MKKRDNTQPTGSPSPREEPIGIVISSGQGSTDEPRFAAYVWSADPCAEITSEVFAVA